MLNKAFSYLGLFFLTLVSMLPLGVLYLLASMLYVLVYHVLGYRKKVVRTNLQNSFPEKNEVEILKIEKEFYKYFVNLIVEIIKMNTISEKELRRRFKFKNADLMESYFSKGESVLICAAHYGNWEWASVAIGLNFSAQNYAIYKPLNNPIFDDWFQKMRSRFGTKMIAMRQTLRAVIASGTRPSIFCFGSDQAPSRDESHYWTTFLNQHSSIQLGVEKIAKKTNRPVFYLRAKVLKRGFYEMECVPLSLHPAETETYEITELHTKFLEKIIKEDPAYWLWSHRRWKVSPDLKSGLTMISNPD